MKNSFPPLLRGIGTVIILIAAVIAFCIAGQHDQPRRTRVPPNPGARVQGEEDSVAALASEVHELRATVEQDSVVEEVLENIWFEWISFGGTAIVAASFFAEAYIRRDKNT